jgi:hypothetical protein
MSWATRAALLAVALLPASCADEEGDTAFDLELTPDPNLGSAEQLAAQIDTVLLVVDSPQGLYPSSAAQVVGNVQVKNVDADAWLELVVTVPVPSGRLPWIRLRQGGLPDNPLDIRVSGVHTMGRLAETVALGRVQGLRFTAGSVQSVTLPFNVRPELLPPRVLQVLPANTTQVAPCRVRQIAVVFSRPMDAASLLEAGAITVTSGAVAGGVTLHGLRLDPEGLVAVFEPDNLEYPGASRILYHVSVATSVRDRNGFGLDQDPAEPGTRAYDADFSLRCNGVAFDVCGSGAADATCPGDGRLDCVDDACLLSPHSCEGHCPGGWTCADATGICEVDCTAYGGADVCPRDRPYCDDDSGVCLATPR